LLSAVILCLQDMVPRMSLWTIERLRDEMMLCALRCKVSALLAFTQLLQWHCLRMLLSAWCAHCAAS
jgi:hypothetical protein